MKKGFLFFVIFFSLLFGSLAIAKANYLPVCNNIIEIQNTGKIFNINNEKNNKAALNNLNLNFKNIQHNSKLGSNPFDSQGKRDCEQFESLISTIYYKTLLKEKVQNNTLLNVIFPNAP